MTAEHAAGVGGEVEALLARWERIADSRERMAKDDSGAWAFRCAASEVQGVGLSTRQSAADTVLSAARRLCCGDNPAPHHAATDAHSQRMAFAEELARAVRGS